MTYKEISNMIEKKRETLIEKIVEAYRDMEDCMQGTHCTVEIYPDGDIVTSGCLTQGSQTRASWEGSSYIVATVPAWAIGWSGYEINFDEESKQLEDYEELLREFETVEDDFYNFSEFIEERYPSIIEKMEREYREYLLGEEFPEEADRLIDQSLVDLELEFQGR